MTFPSDPLAGLTSPNSPSDTSRKEATRHVKKLACDVWGLGEDANVFVAELQCGETDCPDTETVIAVFLDGERREMRVHKPVADLTKEDLIAIARE